MGLLQSPGFYEDTVIFVDQDEIFQEHGATVLKNSPTTDWRIGLPRDDWAVYCIFP